MVIYIGLIAVLLVIIGFVIYKMAELRVEMSEQAESYKFNLDLVCELRGKLAETERKLVDSETQLSQCILNTVNIVNDQQGAVSDTVMAAPATIETPPKPKKPRKPKTSKITIPIVVPTKPKATKSTKAPKESTKKVIVELADKIQETISKKSKGAKKPDTVILKKARQKKIDSWKAI